MFAIYNIQGRSFRDNLEALKRVRKPNKSSEMIDQRDIAVDETIVVQGRDTPEPLTNKGSIDAYRKMLHANERTVIVHAYQVMTHPVITLTSDITIAKAFEEFEKHQVNQFPVYSPQMILSGLVTRMQITREYINNPNKTLDTILQGDVITADPVSDVRRIANAMIEYQLAALPIMNEQDQMVGIISKTDLVKALVKDPPVSLWT